MSPRRPPLAWRLARAEVATRPARLVATLLATTLALAFLVATQVFLATESTAVRQRSAPWATHADVVVQTQLWSNWRAEQDRTTALDIAEQTLAADQAVSDVARFRQVRSLLTHEGRGAEVMLTSDVSPTALRWTHPTSGREPTRPGEIMLPRSVADELRARPGDKLEASRIGGAALTVVGISDDAGDGLPLALVSLDFFDRSDLVFLPPVPGAVPRPDEAAKQTPGSNGQDAGIALLVRTADPAGAVERVQAALSEAGILKTIAQPRLASEVVDEAAAASPGGMAWLPYVVTGAAAIALGVAALTITSTHRMLLAARRRQIALLRAVGAHRGQAAGWLLAEAVLMWAVSAVVAVPLGVGGGWLVAGVNPGTLRVSDDGVGLVVPWARIGLALLVAMAVSLVAAAGPAWQASRVAPVEALSHGALPPTDVSQRRTSALTAALLAVGVPVMVVGHRDLLWTIVGASLVGAACLVGMRVLGPWLATVLGRAGRRPVWVVATANLARNPSRTGSVIIAMLVPLVVFTTLVTGAAVGRSGAHARLDRLYPIDLSLASAKLDPEAADPVNGGVWTGSKDSDGFYLGFGKGALEQVRSTPGVTGAAMFRTTQPVTILARPGLFSTLPIAEITASANGLTDVDATVPKGWIGLPSEQLRDLQLAPGAEVDLLPVLGTKLRLKVLERNLGPEVAAVGPETFAQLDMASKDGLMLVNLDASHSTDTTLVQGLMARLLPDNPALAASGNVQAKAAVNERIESIVRLVTSLLAIVAVVGVVSVGNTLGLAVLERTRESALLRALGSSRAGLRAMVAIEALLAAAIAAGVALVVGLGVGWAGAEAFLVRLGLPPGGFATSGWALAVASVATLLTGALASVVPGAIAARATPVEALADVG